MHGLNNNTNQVQKMPINVYESPQNILYSMQSKNLYISFQLLVFKTNTYRRGKPGVKNPLKGSSKGSL